MDGGTARVPGGLGGYSEADAGRHEAALGGDDDDNSGTRLWC